MPRRVWVVIVSCAGLLTLAARAGAQSSLEVRGKLTITDKGGKQARDVADAVLWLDAPGAPRVSSVDIVTRDKEFTPALVVVGAGSSVAFPNLDPFSHNVFSVSAQSPFDLGLFGRGESRAARFPKAGIARIYCNVHAQMSAAVVVLDTPHYARPAADGSFAIAGVPPGSYTLFVWHERGGEASRRIEVTADGDGQIALALDASGFKPRPHLNKFGKPYTTGRRY